MGYAIRVFGMAILMFMLVGCGTNSPNSSEATAKEKGKGKETEKVETAKEQTSSDDEYPMPILDGWEEIEVVFETIGDGKIDIWHGEFSFEGEIEDYFEPYQVALADMGFDIEITQDDDGMKTLSITKVIDGDERVGNVLFTQNWVKSSLQHFK